MSGDENNTWLDSAPVKGDSANFLTPGRSGGGDSGIEVRPDGVKKFSTQAVEESKSFMSGYQDGVMPLMMETNKVGGSFWEAAYFSAMQGRAVQMTTLLNEDVRKGLDALGMGARTIAINYVNGDTTSAATLPEVRDAFDASKNNGLHQAGTRPGSHGNGNLNVLPPAEDVETDDFTNPNDPGVSHTIQLGDNGSYTIPGATDCLDIEMATPEGVSDVVNQYQDDLAHQNYEPAPYDPDDYR